LKGKILEVHEPCNVASSLEFYKAVIVIDDYGPHWKIKEEDVKAISRVIASIAFGSVFFHSSHTKLGFLSDITAIKLCLFLAYQTLLSNLPQDLITSPLYDLSAKQRPMSAVEMSVHLREIYRRYPVRKWSYHIKKLSVPDRLTSCVALMYTIFSIILPRNVKHLMTRHLLQALPPGDQQFMRETFAPGIDKTVANLDITFAESTDALINLGIIVKKVSSSLFYIEQLGSLSKMFKNPVLSFGSPYSRGVSKVARAFSSLPDFSRYIGSYPGEEWCKKDQGHATWHSEVAETLVDITLLVDQLVAILHKNSTT